MAELPTDHASGNYKMQSEERKVVKRVTYADKTASDEVQSDETSKTEENSSQEADKTASDEVQSDETSKTEENSSQEDITDERIANGVKDEESLRKLKEIMKKTSSALDAYGKIPEKKLSKDQLSLSPDDLEAKRIIMSRIHSMRNENLAYIPANGIRFKPELPKSSISDFDVAPIAKSEPSTSKRWQSEEDSEDYSYTNFLQGRRKMFGPSGLVETEKWDKILDRRRTGGPSSVAVIPLADQTPYHQTVTRVVETKKFPVTENPVTTYCPVCNIDVETFVSYEHGLFTFVAAFLCCFIFPIFILCAWIPFLFTNFMDKKHSCPKCGTRLGIAERIPKSC